MFVNITYVIRFLNAKSFAMSLLNAKPFIGCCDRRTVQHSFFIISCSLHLERLVIE